jgi:CRISPR-associated protein Cmr3
MSIWIIEPHEPLIFRDGRPFSSNPGASANSLPFPFPSTTTGGARTQAGVDKQGIFTGSPDDMLKLKVHGPLLVQLAAQRSDPEKLTWLAPAPADALLLKPEDEQKGQDGQDGQKTVKAYLKRLVPLDIGNGQTDLAGLSKTDDDDPSKNVPLTSPLQPVGMSPWKEGKPISAAKAPAYWEWSAFEKWLLKPQERAIFSWDKLGIAGLPGEQRVHITFDREQHAAKDEALFETNGREFVTRSEGSSTLGGAHQLALAVIVNDDAKDGQNNPITPQEGFATLGGERRIVHWRRSTATRPKCPSALITQIENMQACRIILLTPTYFEHGCYPGEQALQKMAGKMSLQLQALIVERPQVVSGWYFARKDAQGQVKSGPKPTRRLVPAGSVLFVKLEGKKKLIEQWVKNIWFHCLGDSEEFCNDGFGLAVVGTWDGTLQELKGEENAHE